MKLGTGGVGQKEERRMCSSQSGSLTKLLFSIHDYLYFSKNSDKKRHNAFDAVMIYVI